MRTRRGADALFPDTRKRILAALLMHPERAWFASDLARHLRAPKTSLQRELANLQEAGILLRRVEGKHVYYQADRTCPFFADLRGLMLKTAGLVDVVREVLRPVQDRIAFAFVYGSIAQEAEASASDLDLMVVGEVGLADLSLPLRYASQTLAREVNPTVYSVTEFARKAAVGQGFVHAVLGKRRLFVLGTEHDLAATLEAGQGRAGSRDRGGDREVARRRGAAPGGRPRRRSLR